MKKPVSIRYEEPETQILDGLLTRPLCTSDTRPRSEAPVFVFDDEIEL